MLWSDDDGCDEFGKESRLLDGPSFRQWSTCVSALWDVSEQVTKALSSEDRLVATEEGTVDKTWCSKGRPSMVDGTRLGSIVAEVMLCRSVNLADSTLGTGPDTVVAARVNEAESIVGCRLIRVSWGFALQGQTDLMASMHCDASSASLNVIWKRRYVWQIEGQVTVTTDTVTCWLRTWRNYPWMQVADADYCITIRCFQRKALV